MDIATFVLYDDTLPIYSFSNKEEGIMALKMFVKLRYNFVQNHIKCIATCAATCTDMKFRLEESRFGKNGLCVSHYTYTYNSNERQLKVSSEFDDHGYHQTNNTNDIDYETKLDEEIESLERELDKSHNINDTPQNAKNNELTQHNTKCDEPIYNTKYNEPTRNTKLDEPMRNTKLDKDVSMFRSHKVTYVKIKNKITMGTLKTENIPLLFSDKYPVYDFMDKNNLLSLDCDKNIARECDIFMQLYKVIEANNTTTKSDPIDDIKTEYAELCFDFLQYLDSYGDVPIPEKQLHSIINAKNSIDIFNCIESS